MAIITRPSRSKMVIDLSGPGGNYFALLAVAQDMAHKLELDWSFIKDEMTKSDYENLTLVFDKHFGQHIDLIKD